MIKINIKDYEIKHKNSFSRYPLLNDIFKEISLLISGVKKPYVWGSLCGVDLAHNLKQKRVSLIEFGVAGGNGLVFLEKIAIVLEEIYNIQIEVYGFDTGKGLPKPEDYRDLPQLWNEGYFPMDVEKLKLKLTKSKLILGDIKNTLMDFINSEPAPIAFIAFDMDMYGSTMDSFNLFNKESKLLLPRVHCYFDDIMGYSYGDFNGERLAISEFNQNNSQIKISKLYGLKFYVENEINEKWVEQIYLIHLFNHPSYNENDGLLQTDQLGLNNNGV